MKNKLLNDLLKTNGKYSRKSVITFITFIFVIFLGTFIIISDKVLEREVNKYAIDVFNSLLLFLSVVMGIGEASKKIVNKQVPTNEE